MEICRFNVGQQVYYTPSALSIAAGGAYLVLRVMPDNGDGHQYCIRSEVENFDRVVKESELTTVDGVSCVGPETPSADGRPLRVPKRTLRAFRRRLA